MNIGKENTKKTEYFFIELATGGVSRRPIGPSGIIGGDMGSNAFSSSGHVPIMEPHQCSLFQ